MALSALLVVAASVTLGQSDDRPTPKSVEGVIVAKETVEVATSEKGVIKELLAREGMEVKEKDILAKLGDEDQVTAHLVKLSELKVAEKEADNDVDIRAAEKAAKVAEAEWQESLEINRRSPGSVPGIQIRREKLTFERAQLQTEVAKMEQEVAKLSLEIKREEVSAAKRQIERRQIKSPVTGYVEHHFLDKGEWIGEGIALLRIVRMDVVNVEVFVNLNDFRPETLIDKAATITLGTDTQVQGKVTFVSQLIDAGGDYRVWVEVKNQRSQLNNKFWVLKPGLPATVEFQR